jgi:hypothetical protein
MGRHRIVVHEQQEWSGMFGQPRLQPLLTYVAEMAGMGFGFDRVEKQAAAGRSVVHAVRKAARSGIVREDAQKVCAPVVIADAQPHRHRKRGETRLEPFVVVAVAPIGEIAGDDQKLRIVVAFEDVDQRPLEIEPGIAPADGLAGRSEMDIAHMDELHGLAPM